MKAAVLFVAASIGFAASGGAQESGRALLVEGAMRQVGVTRYYDPAYRQLAYPGGDVPMDRGVCSDVIIRSFRHAGLDLQKLVHEDIRRNFAAYPQKWGLHTPDSNIDHRRVPNLAAFFHRSGRSLPVTDRGADYLPGDVVAWQLAYGVPHVGIVSDRRAPAGDRYLVVHNVGAGARLEDALFAYQITGHFRWFH